MVLLSLSYMNNNIMTFSWTLIKSLLIQRIPAGLLSMAACFWDTARISPEKFENIVLFLRLGLPSTLISHENEAFRSSLKTLALQSFWKTTTTWQSRDFPAPVFLKHKSKIPGDWYVFKFLQCSVDGKHLMRFHSKTSVLKFLQHSVDGKHLMHFQSATSVLKFLRHRANGATVILNCHIQSNIGRL